jgi:hypothetical protein
MAICDDIMTLLQQMSDRLEKLEEKVSALSMAGFTGIVTAGTATITVASGGVVLQGDTDSLTVTTTYGDVAFESDVQDVTVNTTGDVGFDGEVEGHSVG